MNTVPQKKRGIKVTIFGNPARCPSLGAVTEALALFGLSSRSEAPAQGRSALAAQVAAAERAGTEVFIVSLPPGGGGRALLSGVARHTRKPVLAFRDTASGGPVRPVEVCAAFPQTDNPPVGFLAVGVAGAKNAALMAAQILALNDSQLARRLERFRRRQTEEVLAHRLNSA